MASSSLGLFCAFLASVTWSVGVSRYGRLGQIYGPVAVNMSRALISMPFFFLVGVLTSGPNLVGEFNTLWQNRIWLLMSTLGSYALADVLFIKSTTMLGVPRALTLASTYPVWAALSGWYWGGEELNAMLGLGLVLVFLGTVLVITVGRSGLRNNSSSGTKIIGVFLAFVTSWMWASTSFAVTKMAEVNISLLAGFRMLLAITLLPLSARLVQAPKLLIPWKGLKGSFWIILGEAFLGAYFYIYGISNSPLSMGPALASLSPIISAPINIVFYGESVKKQTLIGILMVTAGVWALLSSGAS